MQQPTPRQMDQMLDSQEDVRTERALWRRRFVLAERGFTAGFRANTALFFYFGSSPESVGKSRGFGWFDGWIFKA